MNNMTITYTSETLLPSCINDFFKKSKNELCDLSREPDKTILIVDELKRQIIVWLAYHKTAD
jgi:hypothetical protein